MKRIALIIVALMMVASSAYAGCKPEFDAVGCDAENYFAAANSAQYGQIIDYVGPQGQLQLFSVFTYDPLTSYDCELSGYGEFFEQTAGQLFPDVCFPGYLSALTDSWNEAVYKWRIVLQMKPASDIDLTIYDCVMKHNEFDIWTGVEQTGRYRAAWGQLFFMKDANPSMSVKAIPGPFATPGFDCPFYMDARLMPTLDVVPMVDQLYTSKALWDESIVLVRPETGEQNCVANTTYNLKHGDQIEVCVTIPFNNTVDVRYGADSVILKYVGIVGTWYFGEACDS